MLRTSNYYRECLAEEATRILEHHKVHKSANMVAMQDVARERIAKRMEQHTNMVKLLFEARRATTLVPCPWGAAPMGLLQQ